MDEVEVKILEVNREKISRLLEGLGAKKIFEGDIQTLFFDFSDQRIVKAKDVLRLRRQQDKTELTYKKVQFTQNAKVAREISVNVSDLEGMQEILGLLGLRVTECMQKRRVSYRVGSAQFDFDKYSGKYGFIPEFLEIEAQNVEEIHRYAEALGFRVEDCLPWSTRELIRHYTHKK
ncbi:MAG: class IV adenylate cyclase [Candidatus Bathyarchaeota archaeon]|nr:class IV adenylate cyclase [Candidatus Bathyarchaeota archaeon]